MKLRHQIRTVTVAMIGGLCGVSVAWATPLLGTAQSFAALGASTVTNTGSTTLWGDLGPVSYTHLTLPTTPYV